MNTYILRLTNKDGYEWVDEKGEIEVIVADSFDKALDSLYFFESIGETITNNYLEKDKRASFVYEELLPLNISAIEIPEVGRTLTESFIKTSLNNKIDTIYLKACATFDTDQIANNKKQDAIKKLRREATKLGLTLEDLKEERP